MQQRKLNIPSAFLRVVSSCLQEPLTVPIRYNVGDRRTFYPTTTLRIPMVSLPNCHSNSPNLLLHLQMANGDAQKIPQGEEDPAGRDGAQPVSPVFRFVPCHFEATGSSGTTRP